jgi:hypothetical protein
MICFDILQFTYFGYLSGMQYLDQVMGPILFRWVACEMNLVSLVEVTFSSNAYEYVSDIIIDSPSKFVQKGFSLKKRKMSAWILNMILRFLCGVL